MTANGPESPQPQINAPRGLRRPTQMPPGVYAVAGLRSQIRREVKAAITGMIAAALQAAVIATAVPVISEALDSNYPAPSLSDIPMEMLPEYYVYQSLRAEGEPEPTELMSEQWPDPEVE